MNKSALIIGAGPGLSASLARLCASEKMKVILAARNIEKIEDLKKEINAETYKCDVSNIESVSNLFKELDNTIGTPNLVIYNAAARVRGSIAELDPAQTKKAGCRNTNSVLVNLLSYLLLYFIYYVVVVRFRVIGKNFVTLTNVLDRN